MSLPEQITDTLALRPLQQRDASAMIALLNANRDHLDRWLRWSGRVKTLDDCQNYIQRFQDKLAIGDGFHLGIWDNDQLCGGFVCHFLNHESHKTEIGYWLAADHTGKGIASAICTRMISYLIDERTHAPHRNSGSGR